MNLDGVSVGVVGCNDADTLVECLTAIMETVPKTVPVRYADDASLDDNVARVASRFPQVEIIPSRTWRGAAGCRNLLWARARQTDSSGCARVATLDMDIIVRPGWLDALVGKMDSHVDCGVSAFPMCNNQGGHFPVRADGCVAEMASMIGLYRVTAFHSFLGPDCVWGMDERMRLFSHDSEFFQRMKRCSPWRLYLTDVDFAEHKHGGGHSTRSKFPHLAAFVAAQRHLDYETWAALNGRRDWDKGKCDV